MNLEELIKDLDNGLIVKEINREGKVIYIICEKKEKDCKCPYCDEISESVHSKYIRNLKDLPIQNNEVKLGLIVKKFFCTNPKCHHKTFAQRFDFVERKAVRTNRLNEYINNIGLRDNSMDAVRNLKDIGVNVSNNTVLRIVKKNKNNSNL